MEKILDAGLPGFYTDARGAYGIIIGTVYICCFVNSDDGEYDVTVDTVDENGDFCLNLEWESYTEPINAINCLRHFVKKYAKR